MAWDLLKGKGPHMQYHDLESYIYVLLYISTWYKGPRNKGAVDVTHREHPFGDNINNHGEAPRDQRFESVANARYSFASHQETSRDILNRFVTPYFKPLIPLFNELLDITFSPVAGKKLREIISESPSSRVTYESFLTCLQNTLDKLPDIPESQDQPFLSPETSNRTSLIGDTATAPVQSVLSISRGTSKRSSEDFEGTSTKRLRSM